MQSDAAQSGMDEQRRMFEALQQALKPYTEAGSQAIGGQLALAGLSGPQAQQQAIGALEASPQFATLLQQGEEGILQNASATGGLRGGNTQAALGQFRPALLSQLIEQQYGRLGGLASLGQASAAGVGQGGLQSGANIANLMQQMGAAQAGGQIARGSTASQGFGTLMNLGGLALAAGWNPFGGAKVAPGQGVISGGGGLKAPSGFTMAPNLGGLSFPTNVKL